MMTILFTDFSMGDWMLTAPASMRGERRAIVTLAIKSSRPPESFRADKLSPRSDCGNVVLRKGCDGQSCQSVSPAERIYFAPIRRVADAIGLDAPGRAASSAGSADFSWCAVRLLGNTRVAAP